MTNKTTWIAKIYDSILLTSKDFEFDATSKEDATSQAHQFMDGHRALRLLSVKEKE
jgi:hypothetical protein